MDCRKCLEENKISFETKGYGYGYIGKENNCHRHIEPNINNIKWTNEKKFKVSNKKEELG